MIVATSQARRCDDNVCHYPYALNLASVLRDISIQTRQGWPINVGALEDCGLTFFVAIQISIGLKTIGAHVIASKLLKVASLTPSEPRHSLTVRHESGNRAAQAWMLAEQGVKFDSGSATCVVLGEDCTSSENAS